MIGRVIQENLLALDISTVIPDVMVIGETVQAFLEESIRSFVHARHTLVSVEEKNKSVLVLSADRELSLLRAYVLQQAGYSVARADSRQEALQLLDKPFDALVIAYSLGGESLVEMTVLFKERNPNSPIIAVAKEKWQDLKIDADFVTTGPEGPEALLELLETAINRKQLRRVK